MDQAAEELVDRKLDLLDGIHGVLFLECWFSMPRGPNRFKLPSRGYS